MPIFQRLLLTFLAVGALISVPLIGASLQFSKESARLRTEQSAEQQISIIASNFEQEFGVGLNRTLKQINGSDSLAQYLSASREERIVNARVLETGFLKLQADYEIFSGIYFADAAGRMVASVEDQKRTSWQSADGDQAAAKPSPTQVHFDRLLLRIRTTPALLSAGNMEWFMPPRVATIEGPFVDERGRLSLIAGLPSLDFDSGALSGATVIRIRLDTFLSRLRDITLYEEPVVWLFSAGGETLLSPKEPPMALQAADFEKAPQPGEVALQRRGDGLIAFRDLEVIAGTPMLRLAYTVPDELLLRDFRPALMFFLAVLAICAAAVVTIAYVLARKLSAPIIGLAQAAERLARGDMGQRVAVASTGELRILVDSFNQMSDNLQAANENRSQAFAVLRQTAAQLKTDPAGGLLELSDRSAHSPHDLAPGQEDAEDLRSISELIRALMDEREVNLRGLREAKERAERADQAKSQFLANVSHEIRTPLNAVLGMLKLLQSTPLTVRQGDYVTKTEGAARSLLVLLNDVLDFSKAEAEKMSLDPRPFRMDQVLRDLSVILSASVGAKAVEVLFDIDPQLPKALVGDDLRLQQVLINLGGNAIKFTDAGEVVIAVRVAQRTDTDVLLDFSVRDTGIGIALEQQDHIFSGFSQAEASTTRRFGGTGLGLAICQKLVSLMGGRILVDSNPGLGSTFSFSVRLALAPQAEEGGGFSPESMPLELKGLRVLVVDDNPTARDILSGMAQSLGWQVDGVDSGMRAVELARRAQAQGSAYDVVLVDWQMPGMDGWETSLQLRAASGDKGGSLVMMVTAHGREMLAQRSAQEQAALGGFLVKPVTASMLFDAVVDARSAAPAREWLLPVPPMAPKRLLGMRLLVVEDNTNNQQVAKELLEAEGSLVTLAENGQQGVDAVLGAAEPFDAVLMDLQMPVMDGLTATRRIRSEPRFAALPIVAMTANAMQTDRQACLEAGMNEHVGKPFDMSDVVRILQGLVGTTAPAGPPEPSDVAHALDPALVTMAVSCGIDLPAAVGRMGSRLDVYGRSLRSFARDLPAMTSRLTELAGGLAWEAAARELHTLKGLAGMLGAAALQGVCAVAEREFRSGPTEARAQALIGELLSAAAALEGGIAHLWEAVQQAVASVEPPAAEPIPATQWMSELDRLRGMLRRSDMGAVDAFDRIRPALASGPAQQVAALEKAMSDFDFDAAAQACDGIIDALNA